MRNVILVLFVLHFLSISPLRAQQSILLDTTNGLWMKGVADSIHEEFMSSPKPLFSVMINKEKHSSASVDSKIEGDTLMFSFKNGLSGKIFQSNDKYGSVYIIRFENYSDSEMVIENLVPFEENPLHTYITASGSYDWPGYLCRSELFRPGKIPVGVILPDNAWHLGFGSFNISDRYSVTALAKRKDGENTKLSRWEAKIQPNGYFDYRLWVSLHEGGWYEGLKIMFQQNYLFDLHEFDNSLYEREDLSWIRKAYIMVLYFAWDQKYFSYDKQVYSFYDSFVEKDWRIGHYDIFISWPTWPRLGLDQRNQWDMYDDLPGGIEEIKKQVDYTHQLGGKYFISYNPWDEGTRKEDHFMGMKKMLTFLDADGIVLDTKGESSNELQAMADSVRPGIIMYSEGMAVPAHMPGIITGRVHDALYLPPTLNLNKLIKPDNAIFRVLMLSDGRWHRETSLAFFNGYGVEINHMRVGRFEWLDDELEYLGKTTKILRESTHNFTSLGYHPLIETLADSIYVNYWPGDSKDIFTIFSLKPEGFFGPLFEIQSNKPFHYVDIWHNKEIEPVEIDGKQFLPAETRAFDKSSLGTRLEGNVDCIAGFPQMLDVRITADSLYWTSTSSGLVVITAGDPSYGAVSHSFKSDSGTISLYDYFNTYQGKFTIQLMEGEVLTDQRVVANIPGSPMLISKKNKTTLADRIPQGMKLIQGGRYQFYSARKKGTSDPFIPLPDHSDTIIHYCSGFYMDEFPVTNAQYQTFLNESGYWPKDGKNFLKHWNNGRFADSIANCPVVYVSYSDAKAYAKWAGKRLPTEVEWQYAAQGTDMRDYPWGNQVDSTKFNTGGSIAQVDAYPDGASPFGIYDMVGNVWQMTNDLYDNGSYTFMMIKGGSYYNPQGSYWYISGGMMPVYHPQQLLLVAPSIDRCATVGFRCVQDR